MSRLEVGQVRLSQTPTSVLKIHHWELVCYMSMENPSVKTQPLMVSARTEAGVSLGQAGLQFPLAYMWVRSGGRTEWANLQHLLAGVSQDRVQAKPGWDTIPTSLHSGWDWGSAGLG